MTITDVKIRKIMTEGRLRAVVSVTIDDMIAVHDIKVVQGDERVFVAMPSRRDENNIFRDIVHPISSAARRQLEDSILEAYERQLAISEAEAAAAAEAEPVQESADDTAESAEQTDSPAE
ncbi:MAG: septation regulator SpoVG [Ruminococcus sp.]|nr:septation regulator SpoVG [Ruminococcus sp.]